MHSIDCTDMSTLGIFNETKFTLGNSLSLSTYGENLSPTENLVFRHLLDESNVRYLHGKVCSEFQDISMGHLTDKMHEQFTKYIETNHVNGIQSQRTGVIRSIVSAINQDILLQLKKNKQKSTMAARQSHMIGFKTKRIPRQILPRPSFSLEEL